MSEASQFEESLAPLVPLLQLHIVEQLIVDTDESVQNLERVEHLVWRVRVNDRLPAVVR